MRDGQCCIMGMKVGAARHETPSARLEYGAWGTRPERRRLLARARENCRNAHERIADSLWGQS